MDTTSLHFLGIKWLEETPYLVYRPDRRDEKEERYELKSGTPLLIKIADDRYCVGDDGICPYDRKLLSLKAKGSKCFVCGQSDYTQFMPIKGLREEQIETLKTQPHFNYINLFGPELLKVGVASKRNKRKRVLEQGAFATMYFSEGDGFTVRQIEDLVSIVLKITQHVAWSAKYKFFNDRIDESKAKVVLQKTYTEITQIIPERFANNLAANPEIVINHAKYRLNLPDFLQQLHLVDSFSVGDIISGEIVGLFGLIILLKNGSDYYALNTKNMEGYILDISEKVLPIQVVTPGKTVVFKPKPHTHMDLF
jgi:Protein of unknown function (DUF2797)